MIQFWKSLTYTTKFSVIATLVVGFLGLFSMGVLGLGLYYTVSFLFGEYPDANQWTGDWVWPAMIGAGMVWSFGFVIAGIVWHSLRNAILSKGLLRLLYVLILWLWAALVWYVLIKNNL